ncbi:MAG: hypothetical protein LC777_06765 [Actinobacteria bacterium]|nr:hypothetical protein [Actinomycetota bacterium]
MSTVECARYLSERSERERLIETSAREYLRDRVAADQLHGHEQAVVPLAGLEHRDDVRMLGPLLLPEALDERGVVAQPQVEHPQRHHPSGAALDGLVYDSARPGAQYPLDLEASDDLATREHDRQPRQSGADSADARPAPVSDRPPHWFGQRRSRLR